MPFLTNFLESMKKFSQTTDEWTWKPASANATEIFATGAPTSTNQSTYAAETDERSDTDRPNEGSCCIS